MTKVTKNNKKISSQTKEGENGRVNVRIRLEYDTHEALMLESLQSRKEGEKKLLPDIIIERLSRDLKNYPVTMK